MISQLLNSRRTVESFKLSTPTRPSKPAGKWSSQTQLTGLDDLTGRFRSVLSTAVGMVCKDGVVIAIEKIVTSKLYEPGVNKRLFIVDHHVGMVSLSFETIFLNLIFDLMLHFTTSGCCWSSC